MIKLDSLSRWRSLAPGEVLELPGDEGFERRLRLHVNAPGRVSLFLVEDDGQGGHELMFFASPVGRDVVEFSARGNLRIATTNDDVFVYTAELEPTSVVVEAPEVFTQIAQRRARNPELEQMMFLVNQNMERRFAAQAAEHAAELAALMERANGEGEVGIHVGASAQHSKLEESAGEGAVAATASGTGAVQSGDGDAGQGNASDPQEAGGA